MEPHKTMAPSKYSKTEIILRSDILFFLFSGKKEIKPQFYVSCAHNMKPQMPLKIEENKLLICAHLSFRESLAAEVQSLKIALSSPFFVCIFSWSLAIL
ncbi:hypothetical protein QJS83_10755 [Bdellovibrio sp. 22V]|uniref:hypothetical protein n=1 Tax=Bdellovibrio sp. 22V TaxID=3044166 RepID=UPI00254357B5|nr:hypothetical protein [Bdellovibrio sp. 22V]WII70940.1 hypothetical protein QJS83_10755 [Bdellovibrio sp. 22V]